MRPSLGTELTAGDAMAQLEQHILLLGLIDEEPFEDAAAALSRVRRSNQKLRSRCLELTARIAKLETLLDRASSEC